LVAEGIVFYTRAHVRALEAQISRLEQLLAEEKVERRSLLDRLLSKHNVEPVQPKPQPAIPDNMQVIHPFGSAATPEMIDALKESWVNEEAQYLSAEHGMTETQAKEMAERRWLSEHRVIE
jgi:hypothetical protein